MLIPGGLLIVLGDPVTWLENIVARHEFLAGAIITWWTNFGISAYISSLPAPTKNSTQFYIFWFKLSNNILAQNPTRGNGGVRVEHSPNWDEATKNLPPAVSTTEVTIKEVKAP